MFLASILLQLNLRPVVLTVPGEHAYLGVYTTASGDEKKGFMVIETTLIGSGSFKEARRAGERRLQSDRKRIPGNVAPFWRGVDEIYYSMGIGNRIKELSREIKVAEENPAALLELFRTKEAPAMLYNIDVRGMRTRGILPLTESEPESSEIL